MSTTTTKSEAAAHGNVSATAIEKKIARLKSDMSDLATSLADLGMDTAKGVKSDADAKVAEFVQTGEATLDDLRAQLNLYERQVARTVRERPIAALGLAAALGFLLALLFRR